MSSSGCGFRWDSCGWRCIRLGLDAADGRSSGRTDAIAPKGRASSDERQRLWRTVRLQNEKAFAARGDVEEVVILARPQPYLEKLGRLAEARITFDSDGQDGAVGSYVEELLANHSG